MELVRGATAHICWIGLTARILGWTTDRKTVFIQWDDTGEIGRVSIENITRVTPRTHEANDQGDQD